MYRLLIMLFTATAIAFQAVASDASADEKKCSAANGRPSREQFAKIQATTIAADLELDEATTRTFVETYLRNQKEIWEIRPPKDAESDDTKNLTEAQAKKIITERFAHRQRMNKIQEKYYREYSKFLSQKQILRVYDHEHKMMERMMRRRQGKKR